MNVAFRIHPVHPSLGVPYLLTHASGHTKAPWKSRSARLATTPCGVAHSEICTALSSRPVHLPWQVRRGMNKSSNALDPNSSFQGASPLSPCHPDRSEAQWRDLQSSRKAENLTFPPPPALDLRGLLMRTDKAQWRDPLFQFSSPHESHTLER